VPICASTKSTILSKTSFSCRVMR